MTVEGQHCRRGPSIEQLARMVGDDLPKRLPHTAQGTVTAYGYRIRLLHKMAGRMVFDLDVGTLKVACAAHTLSGQRSVSPTKANFASLDFALASSLSVGSATEASKLSQPELENILETMCVCSILRGTVFFYGSHSSSQLRPTSIFTAHPAGPMRCGWRRCVAAYSSRDPVRQRLVAVVLSAASGHCRMLLENPETSRRIGSRKKVTKAFVSRDSLVEIGM